MFDWNEPLQRDDYRRVAFLWLVIPFAWPPLLLLLAPGVRPELGFTFFALLYGPTVLSLLALVILSIWRLLNLETSRKLAWIALVPGAAVPVYFVLALLPAPAPRL